MASIIDGSGAIKGVNNSDILLIIKKQILLEAGAIGAVPGDQGGGRREARLRTAFSEAALWPHALCGGSPARAAPPLARFNSRFRSRRTREEARTCEETQAK